MNRAAGEDQGVFEERIAEYLGNLFDSPRTQQTYQNGLGVFVRFLKGESRGKAVSTGHPISLAAIDSDVLQDFQSWLSQHNYSRFSQRTFLASAIAFLTFALGKDWLPPTFSLEKARARLKQVSRRASYPIPRPDPALPRLIAYYDDLPLPEGDSKKEKNARLQILRSRALIHLLYSSAGRLAEVASLNRKDVADGRRNQALVKGKGDKERFIFITREARAAIAHYVNERKDAFEPLFISHGRDYGGRLSHFMLWRTVKQAARKLGIDVSPHDFRHFRASQMLQQGAPLEAIQEILGHSDISTTRRVYAHYSHPAIRAIFERTTLSPEEAAHANLSDESDIKDRA